VIDWLITSGQELAEEASAKRRREIPPGTKEKKVWKWAVVVSLVSSLQGSIFFDQSLEMQIVLILPWNTVSSSDMNPKSINSAPPPPSKSRFYTSICARAPTIYIYIRIIWILYIILPSFIFCKASKSGFWCFLFNNCRQPGIETLLNIFIRMISTSTHEY